MRDLKVLSLTHDCHNEVVDYTTSVEDELSKLVTWMEWAGPGYPLHRRGESVNQTVKRVMPDADWILGWGPWDEPPLERQRSYRFATLLADIHWNYALGGGPDRIVELIKRNGYDAVITVIKRLAKAGGYPDLYDIDPDYYIHHLSIPILHQPCCINPAVFRDLGLKRDYDAMFLGAAQPKFYPLRYEIISGLPPFSKEHNLKIFIGDTPPETRQFEKDIPTLIRQGHVVGERYVEYLNRARCFLFDTSVLRYTVYKFVESQACGALCMSDEPLDGDAIHLVPEENYVVISRENWHDRLLEVLGDDEKRRRIARAGYYSTMQYNTAAVRAEALLQFLCDH